MTGPLRIDPQLWTAGFADSAVEPDALKAQHQAEYERQLFGGRHVRPHPSASR